MSDLLNQLRSLHSEESEFDKVAEQVFCEAFFDELEKMGYDVEMMKEAGIGSFLSGAAKQVVGFLPKTKGAKALENIAAANAKMAKGTALAKQRMLVAQQAAKDWGKTRGPIGYSG